MMEKINIKNKDLYDQSSLREEGFPKYSTQIINIANQNSRGTRPENVGQLSELFKKDKFETVEDWKEWYLANYPDNVGVAKSKIKKMITKLRKVIKLIDDDMITKWVEDLIFRKTFNGLIIQESILKYLAEKHELEYTPSTNDDESKHIDGFLNDYPISVKPHTWKEKKELPFDLNELLVVYYKKNKASVTIERPLHAKLDIK
jgi:hypothetical protein